MPQEHRHYAWKLGIMPGNPLAVTSSARCAHARRAALGGVHHGRHQTPHHAAPCPGQRTPAQSSATAAAWSPLQHAEQCHMQAAAGLATCTHAPYPRPPPSASAQPSPPSANPMRECFPPFARAASPSSATPTLLAGPRGASPRAFCTWTPWKARGVVWGLGPCPWSMVHGSCCWHGQSARGGKQRHVCTRCAHALRASHPCSAQRLRAGGHCSRTVGTTLRSWLQQEWRHKASHAVGSVPHKWQQQQGAGQGAGARPAPAFDDEVRGARTRLPSCIMYAPKRRYCCHHKRTRSSGMCAAAILSASCQRAVSLSAPPAPPAGLTRVLHAGLFSGMRLLLHKAAPNAGWARCLDLPQSWLASASTAST